jgi:hypothetical protein
MKRLAHQSMAATFWHSTSDLGTMPQGEPFLRAELLGVIGSVAKEVFFGQNANRQA